MVVTEQRKRYPYIWAWGHYMGSFNYYMESEEANAIQDGAPTTAIYKGSDNLWRTIEDLKYPTTREVIERIARERYGA